MLKIHTLLINTHIREQVRQLRNPVQRNQIHVSGTLNGLHQHVHAMIDMDIMHLARLLVVLRRRVLVGTVRDATQGVEAVQLVVHVEDAGVGVVAESPVVVLENAAVVGSLPMERIWAAVTETGVVIEELVDWFRREGWGGWTLIWETCTLKTVYLRCH